MFYLKKKVEQKIQEVGYFQRGGKIKGRERI